MNTYLLTHYGPDGLERGTARPSPLPGPDEIAIRLDAIAINPLDWKIRDGWLAEMIPLPAARRDRLRSRRHRAPESAPTSPDFAVGDRVAGFIDSGAFAETAITRAARLVRVPAGLSTEQAAALPTAAETATRIYGLLRPAPSSTVVVNGAAGAVGSMITQLLVRDGHTVIGTASASNHDYVRGLGAPRSITAPTSGRRPATPRASGHQRRIRHHWPRIHRPRHRPHPRAPHRHHRGLRGGQRQGAIVAGGDPTQLTITDAVRDVFDLAGRGDLHVAIAADVPLRHTAGRAHLQ